jgi:hypothetical protein
MSSNTKTNTHTKTKTNTKTKTRKNKSFTTLCSQEKLLEFSLNHYTYINQIFGDLNIREIIETIYPNPRFRFETQTFTNVDDQETQHHVLLDTITNEFVCSVDKGDQYRPNDTLCQSYSLLYYFKVKIDKNEKKKQIQMVKMYRKILSNDKFIYELSQFIHPKNKSWKNYTTSKLTNLCNKKTTVDDIINKMHQTLNEWEEYGYKYFIDGKC